MWLMGPQGTALFSSSRTHSAVLRVRVSAAIIGISVSRWMTRPAFCVKRSSLAQSTPATSQKRANCPSLPIASNMLPSCVGKSW